MTFDELKKAIETASIRARSLKTKKAKERAWIKVRELRSQALDLLYTARDEYATHSLKGTVDWFHDGDEHLFVRLTDGSTCWASPTSDAVSKSWYGSTCCVQYEAGQSVVVEFEIDVDSDRLCLVRIPRRVHGGTLNASKYAELSKNPGLAFFKYPTGMSGLFSTNQSKGA